VKRWGLLLALCALAGCYQSHGAPEAPDAGGGGCSSDGGGRCLIDRPCWCRIGDDGLAHCATCLEGCGLAGDIHAGGCELWP
jgi:hypothetical protein